MTTLAWIIFIALAVAFSGFIGYILGEANGYDSGREDRISGRYGTDDRDSDPVGYEEPLEVKTSKLG